MSSNKFINRSIKLLKIGCTDFSNFLYQNKYGVLGTLLFHIVLFSILLVVTLNTRRKFEEPEIYIEVPKEVAIEMEKEKEQEIKDKLQEKKSEKDQVSELLKSIAVNKDVKKSNSSQQNVKDMIKNIKQNLKEYQSDDVGDNKKDIGEFKRDSLSAEEARRKQQQLDSLQNIEYSGKSSVYFSLKGRRKINLPIPVFKCENEGKIVVQIQVARNGRVVTAKVLEKQSNVLDDCLFEAALQAAKRTRFNRSNTAPIKQQGSITYHFMHQ